MITNSSSGLHAMQEIPESTDPTISIYQLLQRMNKCVSYNFNADRWNADNWHKKRYPFAPYSVSSLSHLVMEKNNISVGKDDADGLDIDQELDANNMAPLTQMLIVIGRESGQLCDLRKRRLKNVHFVGTKKKKKKVSVSE